MPRIPFPDVPDLEGVPQIPRSPKFPPAASAVLGIVQGALWRAVQIGTQWGVFDANGRPLADPRRFQGLTGEALNALGGTTVSTGALDYSKETRVSDFPVEGGSFVTYNKVELPASPAVILCMGGSENDRKRFLDAIDAATKSLDLYTIVTPEVNYIGYVIERYNYQRRSIKGANLLIVELSLREVRQAAAKYAKSLTVAAKESSATPTVDGGKVQPQAAKSSTLKALINKGTAFIQGILK